jgi:hypothetical protein
MASREKYMHHSFGRFAGKAKLCSAAFAVAAVTGLAAVPSAGADEAQAREIFKAMSDYLAAQTAISFEYDSTLEVVTTENQKIALASSGAVTLERPDKIRATRRGGFANVEIVFDGKTLSLLGKDANAYTRIEVPGDIDHLVDELRDTYHRPAPAADLLMSNVAAQLDPLVTDVKDLGSGVIRGVDCDHLAFRTEQADFQIWIAQGDRPFPCRYAITTTSVPGWPQYTIDVRDWKTGADVVAADFGFNAPAGASEMNPEDLPHLDELPEAFMPKGAQ